MAGSGGSGVKNDAFSQFGTTSGQAQGAYNTINPIYAQEASGTMGLTPEQKANMTTAAMQSTGGSTAGAVGQANLMAARNGNVGGYGTAIDDAARQGGVEDSNAALGVQNMDAQVARQDQQAGLSGLNSIYQDANHTAQGDLGVAASAPLGFWQQYALNGQKAAASAAAAGA